MSSRGPSLDALLLDARWLMALARSLGRDEGDDLLQQAWVLALERPPARSETAPIWFTRVLTRLARMRWRSERARTARERTMARGGHEESAADTVERAESQRWLVDHVLALEEPYRSTILWRYFDGLSSVAIARRAGVPDSTVRTRLARGLADLRERLERERGRTWAAVLVPLARSVPRPWPVNAGPTLGMGVLAMKSAVSIAIVLVALGALGLWSSRSREASSRALGLAATAGQEGARDGSPVSVPARGPEHSRTPTESAGGAPSVLAADELAGRVITAAGEPVAGALVCVVLPRARQWPQFFFEEGVEAELPLAEVRTDANGEFRLRAREERLLDVRAHAEGFAPLERSNVYAGNQLELVLLRAASLAGRVTRACDDSPVEGALLVVQQGVLDSPGRAEYRTTTDARGEYRFDDLPPGWYPVRVSSPGEVAAHLSCSLAEGEAGRVDVVVEAGATISGRVLDGRDESPLAGARLFVWGDREKIATTDAAGEYRLEGIEVGQRIVHVSHEGFGAFANMRYVGHAGIVQDFFLLPGRTARGRVVDAVGDPIAGASVGAGSLNPSAKMDVRSTTSAGDGRFELTDLRIDLRHSLLVRAEGHACGVFDFPAGEFDQMEIELGDVPLEPPSVVSGRLTDLAGQPLSGLPLWADIEPLERDRFGPLEGGDGYLSRGGLGTGSIRAPTDAAGRFLFADLPAGRWRVRGDAKGYVHAPEVEFDLKPGERRTDLELAMDVGLSITGVVTDEGGRPLPGLIVSVLPEGEPRSTTSDLTREDGSFAVHGLDAGRYNLYVDGGLFGASDRAGCEVPCAAGARDLRIEVGRAVEVPLRVVDRHGAPLPGAWVGISMGALGYSMQASDEKGRALLRVPEHGSFDLCAYANPTFDPGANFLTAFFADEEGNRDEGLSVYASGLVAGTEEIVLTIQGLP